MCELRGRSRRGPTPLAVGSSGGLKAATKDQHSEKDLHSLVTTRNIDFVAVSYLAEFRYPVFGHGLAAAIAPLVTGIHSRTMRMLSLFSLKLMQLDK